MLARLQTATFFPIFKTNVNGLCHLLFNQLCTKIESTQVTESPEVPSWAKVNPASVYEDDDSVSPTVTSWIEGRRLDDPRKVAQRFLGETTESDVVTISKILNKRYSSPEEVAEALDGCDISISENKVERLMKRYSHDWVVAFGVFKWAKVQAWYTHSPKLYNFMVDILGKAKQFHLMWEQIEEMNNLGGYISWFTMAKAMRRLARAGKYKEAIDAFRGIERFGLRKDVTALNNLMEALIKENSVEHAYEIFSEFKKLVQVNDISFNILINGWCKVRRLDDAKKIMEDMEKHGFLPDEFSYSCFLNVYCHDKDFQKVYALLDEMRDKGCRPRVVTYTIVMHALGKAKKTNEALGFYEKMIESSCVPDAPFYNSLIFILGKAGRLKDAREVFYSMPKQGVTPSAITYTTMISCACDYSREDEALKLLKKMERASCKPDIKTYTPLLKLFCKKKRMEVLYFLLNHMINNNVRIDVEAYSLLITRLCKSEEVEHACSFFEEMVSKGMVPRDSPYKRLITELEARNMVEAKEYIEKLMLNAKGIIC
ncbi:hypothetical protein TIFTF001_015925 [Ficus carica]|uniref:PROP1-like PPR domain-containing protein n=1 Tax=Ficus carica TaxID=3494 RepID=A0AA88A9P0_FICCA|nr:hypothetical protein TIFTF001_015925 [Ficus carica]